MKIKFGAIVVDGRGKIGGHVASKNRAGAYMRTKVTPVNPSSAAQVNVRARLSVISQAWRSLSQAERSAWDSAVSDYSKTDIFGDSKNPSGFNLFNKLNSNLLNVGEAQIDVPPAPVGVSVFDTFTLAAAEGAGTMVATVTPAVLPAGEQIIVRATSAQSAGKSFVKSEFRQTEVIDAVVGGSIDLAAAWEAKFGDIGPADSKIFVEIIHVNEVTGQVSQAQQAFAVIAA
jgi:hypothetical protein